VILFDYKRYLMMEAESKGYPMVRHLSMHFNEDIIARTIVNQVMLGSDLIFAPVLTPNPESKRIKVYLPKGNWIHIWSGVEFNLAKGGSYVFVEAPIGQPPVYIKKNGLHFDKLKFLLKMKKLEIDQINNI